MLSAGSLKLRLFIAAALAISFALLVAGGSFYLIFQRYIERVAVADLQNYFVELAASIHYSDQGLLQAKLRMADPRFQKPYGGLYWQINAADSPPLRSRSLFDDKLETPVFGENASSEDFVHVIAGPDATQLFALEKAITVPEAGRADQKLRVTIAIDRTDIDQTVREFRNDMIVGLGVLYAVLLSGSFFQISVGLQPLEKLRRSVEAIRMGKLAQLEGNVPLEVRPLVDEVNGLLDSRQGELQRARQRASNLAHGLKTPLTVMSNLAERVAGLGLKSEAQDIHEGAEHMRVLVERELARARMASGKQTHLTLLRPVVDKMVRVLTKTSDNSALLWSIRIAEDAQIAMEPGDLLELVGNVLDNAHKWAKSQINVKFENGVFSVDEDGPGVPDEKLAEIQQRGVRLDEKVSGSGLGLGIVHDLVEIYSFDLKFERSDLGGLSVVIDSRPYALRIERPA